MGLSDWLFLEKIRFYKKNKGQTEMKQIQA